MRKAATTTTNASTTTTATVTATTTTTTTASTTTTTTTAQCKELTNLRTPKIRLERNPPPPVLSYEASEEFQTLKNHDTELSFEAQLRTAAAAV